MVAISRTISILPPQWEPVYTIDSYTKSDVYSDGDTDIIFKYDNTLLLISIANMGCCPALVTLNEKYNYKLTMKQEVNVSKLLIYMEENKLTGTIEPSVSYECKTGDI